MQEGLERLYKAHRQRYAKICEHHRIQFHTLAFDTLGRAHRSTMGDILHLFTSLRCWDLASATTLAARPLAPLTDAMQARRPLGAMW